MEMLSLKTCRADLLQRYLHARFVHIQMQQYAANAVRKISYVQQQFTAFSRQLTSLHAIVSCGHGTCYPQSYSIATSMSPSCCQLRGRKQLLIVAPAGLRVHRPPPSAEVAFVAVAAVLGAWQEAWQKQVGRAELHEDVQGMCYKPLLQAHERSHRGPLLNTF